MTAVVAVVGSVNVDLVCSVDRFCVPGETRTGRTFARLWGGKGANQAVMAVRWGVAVRFGGCVGDDDLGRAARDHLAAEGIDVAAVRTVEGVSTGVALITVADGGENTIVVVPGANAAVGPADVPDLAGVAIVVAQAETPWPATLAAFGAARAAGVTTVLNPAPAPPDGVPAEVLALCDVLCVNEVEAAAVGATSVPVVVRTLGPKGAEVWEGGRCTARVGAPAVDAVDTSGAGDAFVGTLVALMARGEPVTAAVERAVAVAADTVTRPGTQASYPARGSLS